MFDLLSVRLEVIMMDDRLKDAKITTTYPTLLSISQLDVQHIVNLKHCDFFFRLKEETSALMKDRDDIQYKLEKNVIFQQYLEKVLESAEEVFCTVGQLHHIT